MPIVPLPERVRAFELDPAMPSGALPIFGEYLDRLGDTANRRLVAGFGAVERGLRPRRRGAGQGNRGQQKDTHRGHGHHTGLPIPAMAGVAAGSEPVSDLAGPKAVPSSVPITTVSTGIHWASACLNHRGLTGA